MNGDAPAFPQQFFSAQKADVPLTGLNTRLYVATACLQAILSNPVLCENTAKENKMPEAQSLAMVLRSLEIADQLLAIETENRFKRHGTEWIPQSPEAAAICYPAICDSCRRQSPDEKDIGRRCMLIQPSGIVCTGRFVSTKVPEIHPGDCTCPACEPSKP